MHRQGLRGAIHGKTVRAVSDAEAAFPLDHVWVVVGSLRELQTQAREASGDAPKPAKTL